MYKLYTQKYYLNVRIADFQDTASNGIEPFQYSPEVFHI